MMNKNSKLKLTDNKKIIQDLVNSIKENEKNDIALESIFHTPETFSIIKTILSKFQKDNNDVYILSHYLKTLKNFMNSVLQNQPDDFDYIPLLKKISEDLKCEEYTKNTFMMKVGDIGKKFYVIISGNVSVLVPKIINVLMTRQQYIYHLKLLYSLGEFTLLDRTFKNNLSAFPDFKSNDFEKLKNKMKKNKNKITYNEENDNKNITLEKFLYKVNGEYVYTEKMLTHETKIVGYYKVIDLNQGSSFGEYALINDDQQRTASIFVNQNSSFAVLSSAVYKKCLQSIQENNKKKDINFVFNFKIFNQIPIFFFSQNYWNYFIRRKVNNGDYLFKQGKKRDEIYFIQEGEFLISIHNLTHKKLNLYLAQLSNIKLAKNDIEDIGRELDISLFFSKKGDILGLNDLLYNNHFFCSAICISKHASYFAINVNIFKTMGISYPKVVGSLEKIEIEKKILMIQTLDKIKTTNKKSLSGEFRKNEENAVFWEEKNKILNPYIILNKNYSKKNMLNSNIKSFDLTELIKKRHNENIIENIRLNNISNDLSRNNSPNQNNKFKYSRKILPSIKSAFPSKRINYSHSRNYHQVSNSDSTFITELPVNNSLNSNLITNKKNNYENIKTLSNDSSLKQLKRNILKKNREDFISKILLGKSVDKYDNSFDDFYFVNVEEENSNSIILPKHIKAKGRNYENVLMKEITGIDEYNIKKQKLINAFSKDLK